MEPRFHVGAQAETLPCFLPSVMTMIIIIQIICWRKPGELAALSRIYGATLKTYSYFIESMGATPPESHKTKLEGHETT